jgi:hypothetical protein
MLSAPRTLYVRYNLGPRGPSPTLKTKNTTYSIHSLTKSIVICDAIDLCAHLFEITKKYNYIRLGGVGFVEI